MLVKVVDYKMGNIHSVATAFEHLGCCVCLCHDTDALRGTEPIILPGVGSFRLAMERLREGGLSQAIVRAVTEDGAPILGICLGMQLLASYGEEDGGAHGLGLTGGVITELHRTMEPDAKIPHIGFNSIRCGDSQLFRGLPSEFDVYFNHSFCLPEAAGALGTSVCLHGQEFVSSVQSGMRIFGTQFHPEKSQAFGLRILRNFLDAAIRG